MSTDNKKIIFTGPVGAGKTTAIRSISDIDIVTGSSLRYTGSGKIQLHVGHPYSGRDRISFVNR